MNKQPYAGAGLAPSMGSSMRQCPFCGLTVSKLASQCSACRETLPEVRDVQVAPAIAAAQHGKDNKVRRGMLCMLLAAIIHYFAGGYSAMNLPYPINPLVTIYFSPLLFLSGLGLVINGLYLRRKLRLAGAR